MTLLKIDLSDVLDEYHDDDAVVVWAPHHREGSRGQVVNTAQKRIRLTRGEAEQEVEPGPLMIRIQCRGISDTAPKDTVVPDQDSVTLRQLLEQGFTYTPTVVTAVQQARDQTMEYMERAESGADRVGTAERVEEWASSASADAGRAESAADRAESSADEVLQQAAQAAATADATTLQSAKQHANSGDSGTLQSAKQYTDTEIDDVRLIAETGLMVSTSGEPSGVTRGRMWLDLSTGSIHRKG